MAFNEDLSIFFNTNEFAEAVDFTQSLGTSSSSINVIFDARYYSQLDISGLKTVCSCRTSDVPNALGGTIVRNGTTYDIVEDQPDGTGVTVLKLQEQ